MSKKEVLEYVKNNPSKYTIGFSEKEGKTEHYVIDEIKNIKMIVSKATYLALIREWRI